ncbi:MAG: hypothetical protein PVH79_01440 [Candidatus Bathyarchaeota archaeon]
MKKTGLVIFIAALLLLQPLTIIALTAGEAKQAWYNAKEASRDAQTEHRAIKVEWAANKTEENNQRVIESGKAVLHAALDEAEAWLIWRNLEVEENPEIPGELKQSIQDDVDANLAKINELRDEIDDVQTRFELAIVFLKMVGKYLELLTDVARNTGLVWVHIANTLADRIDEYETILREAAESVTGNEVIIELLDSAIDELDAARANIDLAESEYQQVALPGTPLVKFSNGNNYLRLAKNNLLSAFHHLNQAYREMASGG